MDSQAVEFYTIRDLISNLTFKLLKSALKILLTPCITFTPTKRLREPMSRVNKIGLKLPTKSLKKRRKWPLNTNKSTDLYQKQKMIHDNITTRLRKRTK